MKKLLLLFFTYALTCGLPVQAQEVMTLHDCMVCAVENSAKMKLSREEVSDARVTRREAIFAAFTPSVSASSYANANFGRTVDPETNTYKSLTSFNNGYSAGGTIMLFDGFSALNNVRISKTALKMGISQEQQTEDEICLATMEAYCNVLYCTEMVGVCELFVETARANFELARRQNELGQKSRADVVESEADLADREYELVDMKARLEDATLTLKDVMLWPIDKPLHIDTSMTDRDADLLSAEMVSVEEVTEQAKISLPRVSVAEYKKEMALREWRTAKWSLLPSLSLSGGWSTSYYTYEGVRTASFSSQFKGNRGEYLQLNLSIPIFARWSRRAQMSHKKIAYRRASIDYEQTLREVESDVARALQEKESAQAAYFQARKRSAVHEEAYRLNQGKFSRGLISPIEFRAASNTYLKAEAERLDAVLKYYLKRSVVNYYRGISYLEQK